MSGSDLADLKLTPPANFSGSIALQATAFAREGANGDVATSAAQSFSVVVTPVADAPVLTLQPAAVGTEDGGAIPLVISVALTDADSSESGAVAISGVPAGATLNHGSLAAGIWTVQAADLHDLTLTPPPNLSGLIVLQVQGVSVESADGSSATSGAQTLTVAVTPVADLPALTVPATIPGAEDAAIPMTIGLTLADTDGSETGTVAISGVPAGASLNHGTLANGVWTVSTADLANLSLTPPLNFSGSIALQVTATSREGANGDSAITTAQPLTVTVTGVADAPTVTTAPASGAASLAAIPLSIGVSLTDPDSETLSLVEIRGVTAGFSLNAGSLTDDGVYLVPVDKLASLALNQPTGGLGGHLDLAVTAVSNEAGTTASTTRTLAVDIAVPANVLTGLVLDGYVAGATVFADANNNGILDGNEVSAITRQDGTFTLLNAPPGAKLVMVGGTDVSTGLPFQGSLTAPSGSTVVTPLTTLVQSIVEQSSGATSVTDAQTPVKAALGLASGVDLTTFDAVRQVANGNSDAAAVLSAAIQVQSTVTQLNAAGAATSPVDALASAIASAGSTSVNLSDATTVSNLATSAGIIDGAGAIGQVAAAANTTIKAAVAQPGADATTVLTGLAQAVTVALGQTTTAIANLRA